MRHFITTHDWSRNELQSLLNVAGNLKQNRWQPLLKGNTVALLFLNPSLRTRASFQIGADQLGAHAVVLEPGDPRTQCARVSGPGGLDDLTGAIANFCLAVARRLDRFLDEREGIDVLQLGARPEFLYAHGAQRDIGVVECPHGLAHRSMASHLAEARLNHGAVVGEPRHPGVGSARGHGRGEGAGGLQYRLGTNGLRARTPRRDRPDDQARQTRRV